MSKDALKQLDLAAMWCCFGCIGMAIAFLLAALAYRSWSLATIGVFLFLAAFLLTYVGEYCDEKLHH